MNKKYSIPGMVTLERKPMPKDPSVAVATELCCRIGAILKHHYPLHMWQVGIVGDMFYIKAMNVNRKMGVYIHPNDIRNEKTGPKLIMRAGGELLERFGFRRGRLRLDDQRTARRDIADNAIPV